MSALTPNKHQPVDASAGPVTMTLPTGQVEGTEISVEKTDSSTNLVSVTGNLRGTAGSSISLAWQRETIVLRADSAGSWWPFAGHKTKTALTDALAPTSLPVGIKGLAKRYDPRRAAHNVTRQTLGKFYAAVERQALGGAAARVVVIGDSISQGAGATAPFDIHAWPYRLSALLQASYGLAGLGVDPFIDVGGNTQDDRYTVAGTWSLDPVAGVASTSRSRTTTTAGDTFTYASPTAGLTSVKVWYRICTDGGSFTWALDGGATTTVTPNGAEALGSFTVAMTGSGLHSLVLTNVSGRMTVVAVEENLNSGNGGVKIGKFAITGARMSNFVNTGPTQELACLNQIGAPDLTIIALQTNDYGNFATDITTYTTQLQTIITNAKLTGDVLLIAAPTPQQRRGSSGSGTVPSPTQIPDTTSPTLTDYNQALFSLAESNSCGVVTLQDAWGPWATANALGFMFDDYHPSERGHIAYARVVFDVIATGSTNVPVSLSGTQTWTGTQTFNGVALAGPSSNQIQVGSVFNGDLTKTGILVNTASKLTYINSIAGGTVYFRNATKLQMDAGSYWQGVNTGSYGLAARPLASQTAPTISSQSTAGTHVAGFTPDGGTQVGNGTAAGPKIFGGSGAPTIAGTIGDRYHRTDTPTVANQRDYICTVTGAAGSATWVGYA